MSRPDGQAPEDAPDAYWFKCDMDAWALVRDLLPRPWPAALCMQDLRYLEARERYRRAARDGQTALQVRWGVSASTVKRYLAAARAKAGPSLDQPWTKAEPAEPHQHAIADDERTSPGPALDQPWTKAEPVAFENPQQVLILEAPKRETKTESKKTQAKTKVKPGTVTDEEVVAILAEMHAVLLPYYPGSKPLTLAGQRRRILFALDTLAEMSAETGRPARDLLLAGWRFMAECNNGYWQRAFTAPSRWYEVGCQAEKIKTMADGALQMEAARYVPTADEALDAVLDVGCAEAEARYPAAARAIRQAFDFEMGGNLARMRAPKDPDRMRAAWNTGYAKYLTPKLSLVAR